MSFKDFLKRFLPPPFNAFMRENTRMLKKIEKNNLEVQNSICQLMQLSTERLYDELQNGMVWQSKHAEQLQKELIWQREHTEQLQKELLWQRAQIENQNKLLGELTHSVKLITQGQETSGKTLTQVALRAGNAERNASEAVWAQVFNSTIVHSGWFTDATLSPGRWAVGYLYLYVMYRVLNEMRPKRILELGLGQSTRMIGQYAAAFDDVEHTVVEHDESWIDFFKNNFALSNRSKITRLDREMVPYKEAEAVRVFKGFTEAFQEEKFDFICIDAPLGSDMKQYSRIDVLKMLPDCLQKSFVILIDDAERIGETNTVREMQNELRKNNIHFKSGNYSGQKNCVLIASEDCGLLTSL